MPGTSELEIEEITVGLRPTLPDVAPAVGPGRLGGLTWATGHHRNGILFAPLTADLLAAHLARGGPAELPQGSELRGGTPGELPAVWDPGRFAVEEPPAERKPAGQAYTADGRTARRGIRAGAERGPRPEEPVQR